MNLNTQRLKDITVLYCEDEKDLRDVTVGILQNFTKAQFIAEDGQEGLELFKNHQDEIDLIITDVNMPHMSGLEMSKEIKEINPDIPIIVATAFQNSEYLLEAIDLGVDKYVLKPVNIKKLIDTMSQSLLYHELRDLYRDVLTHLPNRNALIKAFESETNSLVALLDIDKFSVLNDLYGEENGDHILVNFAKKLKSYFINDYKIYRVGADKFMVLAKHDEKSLDNLKQLCEDFTKDIDLHGLQINNYDISLSVTIGIAASDDKHAYEYAQRVVQKARQSFVHLMVYEEKLFEQKEDFEENLRWIKKLKLGAFDGHFQPFFQPIVDSQTKEVYKYEALIRYIEDDGTEVAPYKFLPIAKRARLFPMIIKIMLTGALKVIKEKNLRISVNISYEDIINKDTNEFIFTMLKENKDEASLLEFELLESEEIEDFSMVKDFIDEVRSYNCRVGVDDFGAGYSNFNMLEALNIDFVKIDGSLIKDIDRLPKQALIVETISEFCTKLGIKTVAEFVSSEEISSKVESIGITYMQGWHFGKAVCQKEL
ncbi:MAG: EAL domain-containing protein [Arcobacteraceae bacterium]|nr:EAL domain-containing protein [Arcobacteraceae bacterium]